MNAAPDILNDQLPLVSVGIPTYNRPEGLKRTLECITRQNYKNLEIIISDNASASTDVESVGRKFGELDSRIRFFRQPENQGPTFNFQFVLDQARGEFFMWAADDDEWHPDFVAECVATLIKDKDTVLCYSEALLRNPQEHSEIVWKSDLVTKGLSKVAGIKKVMLNQHRNTEFYGLMRTEMARKFRFKNRFGEDHLFTIHMALCGEIECCKPGLFISTIRESTGGSSPANIVRSARLHSSNLYFGYVYQMLFLMSQMLKKKYSLTFFERTQLLFWSFFRYLTPRFFEPIYGGIRGLISRIVRGPKK